MLSDYSERIEQKLFILIQGILYVLFLTLDLTGVNSNLSSDIKFSMIILCFCYVLFCRKSTDKGILFCHYGASFFTVISDLMILMLDHYFIGVLTFIIVQQLYAVRISFARQEDRNKRSVKLFLKTFLIRFIMQSVITLVACILLSKSGVLLEGLLIATVFYFICIVTNVLQAVKTLRLYPERKSNLLFAAGMILFLLCDINVGLFNMSGFIALPAGIYNPLYSLSSILMWTFYAPSQVLITLSIPRN